MINSFNSSNSSNKEFNSPKCLDICSKILMVLLILLIFIALIIIFYFSLIILGILSMYVFNGIGNYYFFDGLCDGDWFCSNSNEAACSYGDDMRFYYTCFGIGFLCFIMMVPGIIIIIGVNYVLYLVCKKIYQIYLKLRTESRIYKVIV